MIIDLRSDTFTIPTPPMLQAMMQAPVGDDVFGEDPSVNQLEAFVAEIFGMDASLFCPSGTMANQVAIKCHTNPGDEVICEFNSHVYYYEAGGIAFNSGCQVKTIQGNRGLVNADQVKAAINPHDIHRAHSSLVSLENTANRGGGACYNQTDLQEIKEVCLQNNLKLHLDGARLFNALVANHEDPKFYGNLFDSISVCLSKGLGAPVGSMLIGPKEFIKRARRVRKVMGGGMRQAGYLAAAGIFALENNIGRLAQDHDHAKQIAEILIQKEFVGKVLPVDTNIIIFDVMGRYTAKQFVEILKQNNILTIPISAAQVRIVTHLGISPQMVQQVINILETL
ncbi:MAG: threonine aldolase [Niastella sp. SCN 39-18]|nr:low-specificity L-threonine aldolase [Sphingobacteriales bacterium]ODT53810.1 MAG: threonine aldolase [Niastella sp. SCN 39-18]OJW07624.1 MAG: threonine aldolase [Sphingobacteriales bacterium 39-19]